MHIVLVPGFWLDASSWDAVVPHLEEAGHTPVPITLPGMGSLDADRSTVTLDDAVAEVVAAIDCADGPVLLVGHSGGCGIATAALDARPERVARVVYVGGFPAFDGGPVGPPLEPENGEVPLKDLAMFSDDDLAGLDEAGRADLLERAIPMPARVVTDGVRLTDERRNDVPATAVCLEYTMADVKGWIAAGEEPVQGFADIKDLSWVDIGTGHWPQFSAPRRLARAILSAAAQPAGASPWPDPPAAASEDVAWVAALERQRATFAWKVGGLDAAGLSTKIGASELTLGKLLAHLSDVEEALRVRLLGTAPPRFTGDWSKAWTDAETMTPDELYERWRASVLVGRAATREALAEIGMDGPARFTWPNGETPNVRRFIADTVEEYSRHTGHADLLREAVDGVVGEDPEDGVVGYPYPRLD